MSNITDILQIFEQHLQTMADGWRSEPKVQPLFYGLLVTLYACLITVGATGNLLVILVVVRNRAMRTPRNVYIVNLAISDLMLCLITMPLTLVEILYMTWQFGDYPAACPVASFLQGVSIFISTLSITAIALDRRKLIVCPTESPPSGKLIMSTVPIIWGAAFAMASPMAIWKTLENWTEFPAELMDVVGGNVTEQKCNEVLATTADYDANDGSLTDLIVNCKINQEIIPRLLGELKTCKEEFPPYGRLVYSCSCQFIQYVLPTITISVAYYQIYGQLKIRLNQKMRQLEISATPATSGGPAKVSSANSNLIDRIETDIHRMRRTIYLLISMGLVFCVCWLPLNIVNLVLDMTAESRSMTSKSISEHQISIIHAVCHVMGMVSACANPIIYGFFNENFHREFSILYNEAKKSLCCLCTKISSNTLVMSPGANGQDPLGNGRNGAGNNEANAIEATPLVVLKTNVTNGTTNINITANNGHQ